MVDRSQILVVDDSEDVRDYIRVVLERAGYEVLLANDGLVGLELALDTKPDLIITDISMPHMDGLTLMAELKRSMPTALPPIIVCSAFDKVAQQALPLGAASVLPKPIESAALLLLVSNALGHRAPDEWALARERYYARTARERAVEAARRAMHKLEGQLHRSEEVLARLVQWVADYFDLGPAAIAIVDGNDIRVAAASGGCAVPVGTRLSGELLTTTGVLAASASLVLPDARILGRAATVDGRSFGIGFLIAVPLVFEGVPIGSLALCGHEPRPFTSEDLLSLEGLGTYALDALRPGVAPGQSLGLWPTVLLDGVIAAEMQHVHRQHEALDLLLVAASPRGITSDWALSLCADSGPRFGVARRDGATLAIFKRGCDPQENAEAVYRALSSLQTAEGSHAAGWVSIVGDRLPLVPPNLVLQLASRALDEARVSPQLGLQRIVLRGMATAVPMAGVEVG